MQETDKVESLQKRHVIQADGERHVLSWQLRIKYLPWEVSSVRLKGCVEILGRSESILYRGRDDVHRRQRRARVRALINVVGLWTGLGSKLISPVTLTFLNHHWKDG